jgi:hypothetical protein
VRRAAIGEAEEARTSGKFAEPEPRRRREGRRVERDAPLLAELSLHAKKGALKFEGIADPPEILK